MEVQENEKKMSEIKLKHPKFGHVIFTNPTDRQAEILKDYEKLDKYVRGNKIVKEKWYNQ